jgi:hypothetical protein
MKQGRWLGVCVFAAISLLNACVMPSGDHAVVFEFDVTSGSPYATVLRISPTCPSKIEIEKGLYNFQDDLSKSSGSDSAGPVSEAFPQYLYFRLIRMTPAAGSPPGQDRATQTQDIRLKVNSTTGDIAKQQVTIAKDMILDPQKNEYILIKMRATGGSIKNGDHLWLTYWNDNVGRPGPTGR